jgi:hypothetical protein
MQSRLSPAGFCILLGQEQYLAPYLCRRRRSSMNRSKIAMMFLGVFWSVVASSQCSICTKTASQLGKQSAEGLNGGIVYLMFVPFLIGGYIGYRWWKHEKANPS